MSETSCIEGEFRCSDSSLCIPDSKHCDGYKDCRNGEDELMSCHGGESRRDWKYAISCLSVNEKVKAITRLNKADWQETFCTAEFCAVEPLSSDRPLLRLAIFSYPVSLLTVNCKQDLIKWQSFLSFPMVDCL